MTQNKRIETVVTRLYLLKDAIQTRIDCLSETEENIDLFSQLYVANASVEAAMTTLSYCENMQDGHEYIPSTIQDILKEAEGVYEHMKIVDEYACVLGCIKIAVAALEMATGRFEAHHNNMRKYTQATFSENGE